jgi:hypothetical protein
MLPISNGLPTQTRIADAGGVLADYQAFTRNPQKPIHAQRLTARRAFAHGWLPAATTNSGYL